MNTRKHLVIPDSQVTPDSPTDHLRWIGQYIVEKQPDVVVHLGDFADMESLSHYDRGKLQFEGRRYKRDVNASVSAMEVLTGPLEEYNATRKFRHEKQYTPERYLTIGNHEHRIQRAVEDDPKMDGLMSIDDLRYADFGWTVIPFLEVLEVDGIHYSHYFYNPLSGRPYGGQSAETRLKNLGFSFVMGHQQCYLVGSRPLNNGKRIRGIVHGSAYLHDESYRGPQGNAEMRAIFMLHEVRAGDYMLNEVSFDFLCRRYEGMPVWKFMQKKYPAIFAKSTWMQYESSRA